MTSERDEPFAVEAPVFVVEIHRMPRDTSVTTVFSLGGDEEIELRDRTRAEPADWEREARRTHQRFGIIANLWGSKHAGRDGRLTGGKGEAAGE